MATLTARDLYFDFGESIDVFQVLGPGGVVLVGETITGFSYGMKLSQDNITAHAGGGQALGVQLTSPLSRIAIVASAGDSVTLPLSVRGYSLAVVNDAAVNAANVFPAVGDAINALGVNNPFSLAAQAGAGTGPTLFYCYSAGIWRTR
jgi:hypothetical protein